MGMVDEAAHVKAPMAGAVIELTITATTARFAIPESFQGSQCTWEIYGDSEATIAADIAFGNTSVAVTYGTASSVTSETITISSSTGMKLVSGSPKHWVMPMTFGPNSATHFSVDATGSGRLKIARS